MPTVIPVPDDWQQLTADWDEIRNGYYAGDKDEAVRDCARRLEATAPATAEPARTAGRAGTAESTRTTGPTGAAEPAGDSALFWTLGLLMLAPYVAFGDPAPEAEDAAVTALSRVARKGDDPPCAHAWHPYEADVDDVLEHLPTCLEALGSPLGRALDDLVPEDLLPGLPLGEPGEQPEPAHLGTPDLLARWQCPHTTAGFARAALDYLGASVG
ncbi:hypothetical protein ACWC1D_06685 [Streptomyces sp. NPDC001478]